MKTIKITLLKGALSPINNRLVDGITIYFYYEGMKLGRIFHLKLFPIKKPQPIRYGYWTGATKLVFYFKYSWNKYYLPVKLVNLSKRLRKP